jgi:cellulose synthase/poly-beta-1,6-N-acetylglucosamine synthase-like glycosyltransferase
MTESLERQQWAAQIITEASSRECAAAGMTNPYDAAPLDVSFFVSCHNESPYIAKTIDTVCEAAEDVGVSFEVIVIDDVSADNSRDLVRQYIDAIRRVASSYGLIGSIRVWRKTMWTGHFSGKVNTIS